MNQKLALIESRSKLINQLGYFEEELTRFLEVFVPDRNKKSEVKQALSKYVEAVEAILANFNEETMNSVVLIGSTVELFYLDERVTETFTIVFPYQANPNKDLISFLSPIAFQLLLARADVPYTITLPMGETSVIVKNINFINSSLVG